MKAIKSFFWESLTVLNITIRAECILETETGLVSLCNLCTIQSQQVIVCEHLDAVVVPVTSEGKVRMRVCFC